MSKTEHISFTGLLGGKSDSAVPLPAPATTASYNLTPGAYTQFLFRMNDVQDVAMDQGTGALRMNLLNGSTIIVQNFKDLARSAETCGRDTVLQFMRDETSATGQMTTKIVNIAPDLLLKTLDPTAAPDDLNIVTMPAPGITREVVIVPGEKYRFDFDWARAAKTEDGTNVMLSFKNGGLVILRDFVPVMQGDLPAHMSLTDGTVIDASKLIVTACTPSESPMEKLAAIEPAAGERHAAVSRPHHSAHVPHQNASQKLAAIEPAAGDGTPGQSGNRGSAGFSSGIDDAALNGLNTLGPLGPTSLIYGTPRLPEQIVLPGDLPTGVPVIPPVTPPPAPTLVTQDVQVYEDGSVGLSATTTAPVGTETVLTISGFPLGWVVDAGLGTFDSVTRVWTMNVPSGATFTGGPVIHPPFNSDGDIPRLDVLSVATSSVTGLSSSATEDIRVITDAVADIPDLSASITSVTGMVAGLSIATAPTDLDGSEQITAIYVGPLPTGVTLNKGVLQPDGQYLLNIADLVGLQVIAPVGYNNTVNFNVTTVVTEINLSDTEFDFTNNTRSNTVPLSVQFVTIDGTPTIGDSLCQGDETILNQETLWFTGDYAFNYGSDGAGAVTLDQFTSSGSKLNGALSSGGVAIVVTAEGNDFVGRAGNVIIFKMSVNTANATYRFEQYQVLDHADGSNPNDVITLDFGIKITDADGDTDTGVLRITLADDAPFARGDTGADIIGGESTSGNVFNNDIRGADDVTAVTSVTLNATTHTLNAVGITVIEGIYGTLSIGADGAYTYTAKNDANGRDNFTYTIRDFDGDTSSAELLFGTSDGVPSIGDGNEQVDETNLGPLTASGALVFNYGADGPGIISAQANSFVASGSTLNGHLSFKGTPVQVSLSGNTWTGTALPLGNTVALTIFTLVLNNDGTYAFTLYDNLDHANATDPNDVITLNFGAMITDANGDQDTGVITIQVIDDAPIARDDTVSASFNAVGTGNVLANDSSTEDPVVTHVIFNGQTYVVSTGVTTEVQGDHGVLTMNQNGAYTYRPDDVTTETICVNPVATDVVAVNDSDFSRNGITVTAIDPNTGITQGDLTWITGNITQDGSWYGEQGVGIAGSGSNFINGTSEGLRLAFDTPQNEITITISAFNSMSDFVEGRTEQSLNARVYLEGLANPVNYILTNGWSSGYGLTDYTLTSAQFGGRNISSVEIFSTHSETDWNLYNTSYNHAGVGGTDVFQYRSMDRDGDAASAFLRATNTTEESLMTVSTSAVLFDATDSIQSAINDYVISTTDSSVFTSIEVANDTYMETTNYLSPLSDDLAQQTAA